VIYLRERRTVYVQGRVGGHGGIRGVVSGGQGWGGIQLFVVVNRGGEVRQSRLRLHGDAR
jgi:hypothetical protein